MARAAAGRAAICLYVTVASARPADTKQEATARIVRAANGFLSTLSETERQRVLFPFDDEKQRANWSNFPIIHTPRAGISLKEMNANQRAAVMALLSTALSPRGFEKVQQIMDGDEVNKKNEGNPFFGKDLYYISMLRTPSEKNPWMLQFGGRPPAATVS